MTPSLTITLSWCLRGRVARAGNHRSLPASRSALPSSSTIFSFPPPSFVSFFFFVFFFFFFFFFFLVWVFALFSYLCSWGVFFFFCREMVDGKALPTPVIER